jgi:hypothetical protein
MRLGRVGLSIPTWLSVTAIVACGADENGDEQADTGPADDSGTLDGSSTGNDDTATSLESSGSTSGAESSGTSGADEGTTAGSSGVDSGSTDTGELPDCMAIAREAECGTEPACIWHPDYGPACVVNCELLEDEATCDPLIECLWYEGMCEFEFLK